MTYQNAIGPDAEFEVEMLESRYDRDTRQVVILDTERNRLLRQAYRFGFRAGMAAQRWRPSTSENRASSSDADVRRENLRVFLGGYVPEERAVIE